MVARESRPAAEVRLEHAQLPSISATQTVMVWLNAIMHNAPRAHAAMMIPRTASLMMAAAAFRPALEVYLEHAYRARSSVTVIVMVQKSAMLRTASHAAVSRTGYAAIIQNVLMKRRQGAVQTPIPVEPMKTSHLKSPHAVLLLVAEEAVVAAAADLHLPAVLRNGNAQIGQSAQ